MLVNFFIFFFFVLFFVKCIRKNREIFPSSKHVKVKVSRNSPRPDDDLPLITFFFKNKKLFFALFRLGSHRMRLHLSRIQCFPKLGRPLRHVTFQLLRVFDVKKKTREVWAHSVRNQTNL